MENKLLELITKEKHMFKDTSRTKQQKTVPKLYYIQLLGGRQVYSI